MRFASALALVIPACQCCAAPIATFEPGHAAGVEPIAVSDGLFETRTVSGRQAVTLTRAADHSVDYLYFKLSPEARWKAHSDVWLVVDFLDDGVGIVWTNYNSDASWYDGTRGFLLVGSGSWARAVIHLTNCRFRALQNAGADFRFAATEPITVSRIEVHVEDPGLKLASDKERVMKTRPKTAKPKGMFYTFGNDADESTGPLYASLGVTSIESYVTWETCEGKGEGQWDWSRWDKQVRVLKDNGLKWVPFLILGPAYSTPNWFRAGKDHCPCRCLEHGTASKIESLWNPNLPAWIDRFLGEFAERYRDSGVIESVLLGIQGDYGEAIYSVSGGGWTFEIPGKYHNHAGFWCDDPHALADFRKFVARRYKTVDAVNSAWGTGFASLGGVDFPGRKDDLKAMRTQAASGNPQARRRWLDFVDWYRGAMTRFSDWWIAATRKHFPRTPIYLCTGGDAPPEHGSDFAEQCRVAAKHKAGVRITNEASSYPHNFTVTRWVASAGKHYGAYFGFEPAGPEDLSGIVARIYNATASGANQLHDYSPNVINATDTVERQQMHMKYLFRVAKPMVPVALWYPNVAMTLKWGGFLEKAAKLRDYTDFDYIDETMLATSALRSHSILVILHGAVMETADARRIADWIEKGGRAIVMDVGKLESVEATSEPETILFGDTPEGRALGKGRITRAGDWAALASDIKRALTDLGLPVYDLAEDGVYGTQIGEGRFLFLNAGSKDTQVEIRHAGKQATAAVSAKTITEFGM